jgi:hypothetical protein
MNQYLHKYLSLNKKLSIPDIGNFVIESSGARLDSINGLLYAPTQVIQFTQDHATADKYFFDFLANELGVEDVVAIGIFHDYVYKIKSIINTPQGFLMKGIGTLKKEDNGHIIFTPEKSQLELMPRVQLDSIYPMPHKDGQIDNDKHKDLTSQKEEDISALLGQESEAATADNWWIYAIILFLIGVGAIMFHYV